ncbi:sulfite exporter TauE/SafE family protein [Algicella marina]|uniref:Probable membrane transporter protein n=1 Tax=Algicella marina TaxID=2683284 RepID=A0A6P1T078_9RHOB|nr:sulfite exporter TauE/SafE family protein [Algicella marina]QHQ35175.1 TSUP family transporter [Algicella marina]
MTADLLHGGLGWGIAGLLLAVSFASSLITAAFGIGGGTIMLAVLASLLPPPAIIPVHGLVQLGSNCGRAAILLRHFHKPVFLPFLLGAAIGVAAGGAFAVQMDAGLVQIGVGVFILWSIFFRPPAFLRASAALSGGISSLLTMFFGATGPFVAAYVKTLGLGRMEYVATHAGLMTVQHLLKSVVFGLLGFAFSGWAGIVVLLVAAGFLGTLTGKQILMRIDEARFRLVLNCVLALLAARLIWAGARAVLAAESGT